MFPILRKRGNLRSKFVRVFVIQIALISAVTIVGVYAAKVMVESVLLREALEGEATYFWSKYQRNPETPLPDTYNLTGYLSGYLSGYRSGKEQSTNAIPAALLTLKPGLHRATLAGENPLVYVEDKFSKRLYLVFDENSVSRLALLFGVLPLTTVLIILYLLAWLGYRQSQRAISPVVNLARHLEQMDFQNGQWVPLDVKMFDVAHNPEVYSMVTAINHFIERLQLFIDRERLFTRDASHELRTPIAVLKSALEVLERKYDPAAGSVIERMKRTLHDMEGVTETLLLLARDESQNLESSTVVIESVVQNEIRSLQLVNQDKPVEVELIKNAELTVEAPERVVAILVGNLLGNAFNYTPRGNITVLLHKNSLEVMDSGIGMKKEELEAVTLPFYRGTETQGVAGHGVGMAIVQRLCARYQWQLSISSSYGKGTRVRINFKTQ